MWVKARALSELVLGPELVQVSRKTNPLALVLVLVFAHRP
jgi:hypothetical protein